jgi:muramoyltetrapeptide carboxypeptidase LdcA involved in peptidoglycan recycling
MAVQETSNSKGQLVGSAGPIFVKLSKLKPGDLVSVIASSSPSPALFPQVFDQGLARLKEVFQLSPKEYPDTRGRPNLKQKARHIMEAFEDPDTKAVFSAIGGDDQIRLLKHLDPAVFINHPKPFFGYSDNTNMTNFLWRLGIPSYYGGAVMLQLAEPGGVLDFTRRYLEAALFQTGEIEFLASAEIRHEFANWAAPNWSATVLPF